MSVFESTRERLKLWAKHIENARAEVIADITKEAIKDLAGKRYFSLPDEFISYIEDYETREGALQSIADYRDHFIHPFHVFCLGYLIYDQWIKEFKENKIKRIPLDLTENPDPDYNLTVWFIASIYHDVGFPSEKPDVLIHDFFKTTAGGELRSQFDWSSIILANDNIKHIDILSSLFTEKICPKNAQNDINQKEVSRRFEKWFHKRLLEDHDHGVLTALMSLNQGWKTEKQWNMAYEAALAISLHSYRCNDKGEESLDFNIGQLPVEDFPLAFFLSYCDCAQEWGRKVLLELIKKSSKSSVSTPVHYLSGINSKLKAPVPMLLKEMINGGERIKTTVIIKYPIRPDKPVSNGETLEEVFKGYAKRFESTWYLKNQREKDFWIQGEDVDDVPIGYLHPSSRDSHSILTSLTIS